MRILRARLLAAAQEEADAGGVRRAAQPGPHRRPLRAGPHLQLPGEPDLRPPGRLQGVQPRPGARRRPRRRHPGAASTRTPRPSWPPPRPVTPDARAAARRAAARRRRHAAAGRRRRALAALRRRGARRARRSASSGGELWRHDVAGRGLRRPYGDVDRRAAREPLQHITGRAFFRHLELRSGPGVFVPRPETEVVAGAAIDAARAMDVAERAGRRRPVHRVRRDRAGPGQGGARARGCTPSRPTRTRYAWAARNVAGSGVDLRLGRHGRRLPATWTAPSTSS